MNRCFAFVCALLLALLSVSSACLASPDSGLRFTLGPSHGQDGRIRADFRSEASGHENNWSTDFRPAELVGLDNAGFRASGTRPLRFALIREAGRIDCAGQDGGGYASGNCSFTPDPRFMQLLDSRGIRRPTGDQSLSLMALDVRSDLVNQLAAARYPTPTVDELVQLTAVGADGRYISQLANAGYRPSTIDSLVQFRAIGITPEWIAGFARIGYASLPGDDLVQLRALGITPDYIEGFDRIGYRNLPVDSLVQLKALGVTPDFARAAASRGASLPSVDYLVQMKALGRKF